MTIDAGHFASPDFASALAGALARSEALCALILDETLHVLDANPAAAAVLGAIPAGTPLADWVPAEDHHRLRSALQHGAGDGVGPFLLRSADAPDDPRRALLVSVARLDRTGAGGAGFVLLGRQAAIEAARERRILAARRYQIVGQLSSGVAHDLNNRLSTVTTFSDLLLADAEPGSQDAEDLEEIKVAGLESATITRKLDLFAGGHAGGGGEASAPEVVRGLEKLFRRFLGGSVTLTTEIDDGVPPVAAPPIRVEEALVALVANARDAVLEDGGGTVTVRVRPVEDAGGAAVALEVHDTGSTEVVPALERALEPLFSSRTGGTYPGLGLTTVAGIVAELGGDLRMTREPGGGTTATVTFPATRSTADHEQGDGGPAAEPASRPLEGVRIALIEPVDGVRTALGRALSRRGARVLAYPDSGRFAAAGPEVDVCVADVPEDPGAADAILAAARAGEALRPVLLLRRRSSPLKAPVAAPAVAELAKPTGLAEVEAALVRLLASD